jgi:riboflavin kinase/FMN adenylyltransferase
MATHSVRWNDPFPPECRGGAVTIGNFDGVHKGHQALLAELHGQARAAGGPAVAVTFDPPPSQLLRPDKTPAALATVADRAALMQTHGADHVVILQTTLELLRHTAAEFFDALVVRGLSARVVVPGFNFAFGRNREGTVERLAQLCHEANLACVPVPPLALGGQPVSSSRIRDALLRGDVAVAAELLGRPHRVRGIVATGQRRGQTLGFPTANLDRVESLVPGDGVYAVRAEHAGRSWPAAANVGPNPTFGEHARKIEVHLLDFHGDLYGATLAVDFVARLRDTRKFAGPAELKAQLATDIAETRRLLENPQ